ATAGIVVRGPNPRGEPNAIQLRAKAISAGYVRLVEALRLSGRRRTHWGAGGGLRLPAGVRRVHPLDSERERSGEAFEQHGAHVFLGCGEGRAAGRVPESRARSRRSGLIPLGVAPRARS